MMFNRTNIFIAIASIALLSVLVIQVNWIFQTAKIKEELFNEKAELVLAKTTDALYSDQQMCQTIEASSETINTSGYVATLPGKEIRKIDSLLQHAMKFYGFHVDYSFEVIKSGRIPLGAGNTSTYTSSSLEQPACGEIGLQDAVNKNGFELKLIFPEKKQFIIAEMGVLFITSLLLIIVVLVLFWRTIRSLLKEKKISEHTTEFLNNMTHEFKTPLTNIALAGKMIVKDSTIKEEDKIKHYSAIILEENEKLRLQVEQVLSMTALEKGEIPLQKTELDVHQLLQDCIKSMTIQIENKHGQIQLKLNANNFVIMGDKSHLANAFSNLIDNAIKYSSGKPELTIETFNRNNNLVVVVADKGIGIEKEYQKKVFEKYFRVPTGDVHDVKGFGLGLAYVKTIVELHGGTIELQSDKGTTFNILIPYA
ncbi:MAG: HAMP domain-containing histidine kinase [Bacteroidetes bacterium]|nr:HAMP domain-containing histidine kinase [Bacteroidota bacterium]